MTWRRAAIGASASVAAVAGAVSIVASAVAADQAPPRPADPTGPPGDGPYRSSVTITLDGSAGSCAAPCGVPVRLPVGASEDDVLRALGEPRRRRTLGPDGEAWDYTRYLDEEHYAFAMTTVTFDGHRLVDAVEYQFK